MFWRNKRRASFRACAYTLIQKTERDRRTDREKEREDKERGGNRERRKSESERTFNKREREKDRKRLKEKKRRFLMEEMATWPIIGRVYYQN